MRSILFLLLTLSVSISRAAVVCVPNPDGSWTCSGSGSLEDIPGLVVTNGLGVCTNCVSMTQDQCEGFKSFFMRQLIDQEILYIQMQSDLISLTYDIKELKTEGDMFGQIASVNTTGVNPKPSNVTTADWFHQNFTDQVNQYILSQFGTTPTTSINAIQFAAGNSLIQYYTTAVAPVLEAVDDKLNSVISQMDDGLGAVRTLQPFIQNEMNCEACTIDLSESGSGGSGSGGSGSGGSGSGGSGSGGSGSGGCGPCVEQIQALKTVVNSINEKVDTLQKDQKALITKVTEFKAEVRQCFDRLQAAVDQIKGFSSAISNNTFRIDSYLRTDLDNMARDIATNVLVIAQNVDGIQKDYYTAFKNAASFLDSDGNPGLTTSLTDVQTNFLSETQYRNLPWPMRVEMLLLSLAKPFSSSDDFPQPSDDAQKDVERAVGALDALDPSSHLQEYQTSTRTVLDSLTTTYSGLSSVFSNPSLPQSVRLLEADQWIGDQGLMINLDPNVCSPCRVIFSLIWSVIAMVLLVKAWLLVFRICLPVFDWCRKFVHILVKA